MTLPLALAIEAYVAVGVAWASYALGYEAGAKCKERSELYDLALYVLAWPVVGLLLIVARALGGKSE